MVPERYYSSTHIDPLLSQCKAAFPKLKFTCYNSIQTIIATNSKGGIVGQVHVSNADFMNTMRTEIAHYNNKLTKLIAETEVMELQAKIVPGYIRVSTVGIQDGVSCLSVDCPDYDARKALPEVLEYEGKLHCLTGWNSDVNMAYYKNVPMLAKVVK